MAAAQANAASSVREETQLTDSEQTAPLLAHSEASRSPLRLFGGSLLALALVGAVLCLKAAAPQHAPLRGKSSEAPSEVIALDEERSLMRVSKKLTADAPPQCSKLWGQCGGLGYMGPTCCEEGSVCTHKPLLQLSSYRQCMRPDQETCGGVEPDSQCAKMIYSLKYDLERAPENFKGLWTGMDEKEYQMYAHWGIWDESHCPEPCADGTCFVVLQIEGCDTLDTWYCSHDDGSLKFACCCRYMHEETELDKPTDVDTDMAHAIEVAGSDKPSLFCTTMVQPEGYEISLLREQYARGKLGLFACNEWAVYSNTTMRLSPKNETPVLRTALINGSLSAEVGGSWSTALNTEVFIRFWDTVMADSKAWTCDWIVKIDPDAVWIPRRLRVLLQTRQGPLGQPEPETGFWLNNCYLGLHGPIEVLSTRALRTYNASQASCRRGDVAKIGQEDYFIRECFKMIGIQQVDAYNLLLESDFACGEHASGPGPKPPCFAPQVAFHPFKSVNTWMRCHHEAANHPWALPAVPATDPPSDANSFRA